MSLSAVLAYATAWALVALVPGPAVWCVMSQVAASGLRAGTMGIVGIQLGNLSFFVCIAFGLVTLLLASANALTILQVAGASYLVFLGVRAVWFSFRRSVETPGPPHRLAPRYGHLIVQAAAVQFTNPKALLFMSALLPQFIDFKRPASLQLFILASCTVAIDAFVLTFYACLAQTGARSLRLTELSRWLERACGAMLIVFGVRLLLFQG